MFHHLTVSLLGISQRQAELVSRSQHPAGTSDALLSGSASHSHAPASPLMAQAHLSSDLATISGGLAGTAAAKGSCNVAAGVTGQASSRHPQPDAAAHAHYANVRPPQFQKMCFYPSENRTSNCLGECSGSNPRTANLNVSCPESSRLPTTEERWLRVSAGLTQSQPILRCSNQVPLDDAAPSFLNARVPPFATSVSLTPTFPLHDEAGNVGKTAGGRVARRNMTGQKDTGGRRKILGDIGAVPVFNSERAPQRQTDIGDLPHCSQLPAKKAAEPSGNKPPSETEEKENTQGRNAVLTIAGTSAAETLPSVSVTPGKAVSVAAAVEQPQPQNFALSVDTTASESFASQQQFVATDNMANFALAYGARPYGNRKVGPEDFVLLKVIGKGSYGKVMMVRYKHDNNVYAMKMLRKENIIKRNQVEHTRTERTVLESINHPFIVQLFFAFQTPKKLYFVMEYCPGGELFFHLSRAGRFRQKTATFYAAEIILALEHLHNLDIVYRDLKPENVLLDAAGHIRLTDFGLSKKGVQDNFSAKSLCGTPEYLAPEILNQTGHGKAVDWWNLGALIYEMLTGLPPFYTRDRERLFENIRSGELRYPSYISDTAKSLLMGLFQRDPNLRLGGGPGDAQEIKNHPMFAHIDWDRLYRKKEVPPFEPSLSSQTDVQYFDNEFVKLPVVNSEAPESTLAQAARDEPELFQGFTYDGSRDE